MSATARTETKQVQFPYYQASPSTSNFIDGTVLMPTLPFSTRNLPPYIHRINLKLSKASERSNRPASGVRFNPARCPESMT